MCKHDDTQPNPGCDRCGTNDRTVHSRYCQACLNDGYCVHAESGPAGGTLYDDAATARSEALLAAADAADATAEVHGPDGYRERIELGADQGPRPRVWLAPGAQQKAALHLAAETLIEHRDDGDSAQAMTDAARVLEEMADLAQGARLAAAAASRPSSAPQPRGSVEVTLEVFGRWSVSHLTRTWTARRRTALLSGDRVAEAALLDAAEHATRQAPNEVQRTVHSVRLHGEHVTEEPADQGDGRS